MKRPIVSKMVHAGVPLAAILCSVWLMMTVLAPALLMELRWNVGELLGFRNRVVLRLGTASKAGSFHWMGSLLREHLRHSPRRYEVEVVETAGSRENIELLRSRKVDLAFVHSALKENMSDLRALANIS